MLSCARFLRNRARELLERDALKALDVCVLVKRAHSMSIAARSSYTSSRSWLFLLLVSLSLFADSLFLSAGPLTLSAFSASLFLRLPCPSVLSRLSRRLPYLLSPQPQLVQASALYIMGAFGQLVTSQKVTSVVLLALAAPFVHSRLNHRQLVAHA